MDRPSATPETIALFSECLGCKWTLPILWHLRSGPRRPGELRRLVVGVSTKVLGERLAKLQRFRLVERSETAGRVRRVDYELTAVGRRFADLLSAVDSLIGDVDAARTAVAAPGSRAAGRRLPGR